MPTCIGGVDAPLTTWKGEDLSQLVSSMTWRENRLREKNSIGREYLLNLGKANSNFKIGIMFCS